MSGSWYESTHKGQWRQPPSLADIGNKQEMVSLWSAEIGEGLLLCKGGRNDSRFMSYTARTLGGLILRILESEVNIGSLFHEAGKGKGRTF